jgi:hypothetical protein
MTQFGLVSTRAKLTIDALSRSTFASSLLPLLLLFDRESDLLGQAEHRLRFAQPASSDGSESFPGDGSVDEGRVGDGMVQGLWL